MTLDLRREVGGELGKGLKLVNCTISLQCTALFCCGGHISPWCKMSTKSFEKSNCCFYFPIILNNCTRPPPPARLKGLGLIWFNLGFNQTYNHTSTNVGEMHQIVVQQTNHQRGRISFHSWLLGNDDALGWWWRWWWCSWCWWCFHHWRWCVFTRNTFQPSEEVLDCEEILNWI